MLGFKKIRLQGDLVAAFQLIKGICKKGREKLFTGAYSDRTKGNGLKLKEKALIRSKEEILHYEDGEILAQNAQRCSRCPTMGSRQGWLGC